MTQPWAPRSPGPTAARAQPQRGIHPAAGTVTECPYKGTTSGYWSVQAGGSVYPDIAWSNDFPTRQLQPIANLVAFYNEKVDIFLDGRLLERPKTHFFPSAG